MTHVELVEAINGRLGTDFWFADNWYYCCPKGCTKKQARKAYEETNGKKAPKIDEVHYFIVRD